MSELNDLAKFISEATGEPCEVEDILHVKRAKEPLDGSPLESVVPGRSEIPSLNPDRSRDALERIRDELDVLMNNIHHFGYTYGMLVAIRSSISSEIERQHSTQNEAG